MELQQEPRTARSPALTSTAVAKACTGREGSASRIFRWTKRFRNTASRTASPWTNAELAALGGADVLHVAPLRSATTLVTSRSVWVARHRGRLFVRSVHGPDTAWFSNARERRRARVVAAGLSREVAFIDAEIAPVEQLDRAFRDKYQRCAPQFLEAITSPEARAATFEIVPSSVA